MGGVLLSFGGILSLIIGGGDFVNLTPNFPGLNKLLTAAVFPIGLIMIVLSTYQRPTLELSENLTKIQRERIS